MNATIIWPGGRIEKLENVAHTAKERSRMALDDEVVRLLVDEAINEVEPLRLPTNARDPEPRDALDRIKKAMNNLGIARSRIRLVLKDELRDSVATSRDSKD